VWTVGLRETDVERRKMVKCPHCRKEHESEFYRDEDGNIDRTMRVFRCEGRVYYGGMISQETTVRDYFIGQILSGLLDDTCADSLSYAKMDSVSKAAVTLADFVMRERR